MRECFFLLGWMLTVCGLAVIVPALLAYKGAVRVGVSDSHAQAIALIVGMAMIGAVMRKMWS